MRMRGSATAPATSSFNRHAHMRLAPRPRESDADERGPTEDEAESSGVLTSSLRWRVGARLRSSASPCGSREREASLGRPAKFHVRTLRAIWRQGGRDAREAAEGGSAALASPIQMAEAALNMVVLRQRQQRAHRTHRRLPYTVTGGWTIASFKNPTKGRGLGTQLARSAV
jgi:hypothetical protein